MKGIANLEIFEINEAKENFENALGMDAKDVLSNFFIAVCYMFLDDQASKGYIKKAYSLDRKKTKELIKNFYEAFFSRNKYVSKKTKEQLEKKMETIGSS
jgi:Tfp pilus assembly protein PilF